MFKSKTQPLCRYCGGKIAKQTGVVWFGSSGNRTGDVIRERTDVPRTRDEAQRLINDGKLVSVRWSNDRSWVTSATFWDGESYIDEFFCNGTHARYFAYACAVAGKCTEKWQIAYDKQRANELEESDVRS